LHNELNKSQYNLWLSRSESKFTDYLLAESYLNDSNIVDMNNVLGNIPIEYDDCDLDEYSNYLICIKYLRLLEFQNDTLEFSQEAIDTLENILTSGYNLSSILAESILERIGKDINVSNFSNICNCTIQNSSLLNNTETQIAIINKTQPEIMLMPNPAQEKIFVKVIKTEMNIDKIVIYDIYGKTILQKKNGNSKEILLDVSELSTGFYFISCELENHQTIVKKMTKN